MPENTNTGGTEDQAAAGQGQGGQGQQAGQSDGQGQRETMIPRERFDEVNKKAQEEAQRAADLEARNRWLEEQYYAHSGQGGTQASPAHQSDQGDGIPKDYGNWEEWHAADPGSATDWRARRAYYQERQVTEAAEGRQRFLDSVYGKRPDLQDPVKRNGDATYRKFASFLRDNPAAGSSERGLNQLWRLAELEVAGASGTQNDSQGNQRQAGAQEEFHRQAATGAVYAPSGTGTRQQGQQQAPQLSGRAERVRQKYGMSAEEFVKGMEAEHETSGARIPMKYEKAQKPK